MKRQLNIKYVFAAVLISFFFIFSLIFSGGVPFVYASASSYSDVVQDLYKDKSFNVNNYPAASDSDKIEVIQIGESDNQELFIYTYQPGGQALNLIANQISIAQQLNNSDDLSPALYPLEFLNSTGVFYKYKVSGYKVSEARERFYNLIMIQRPVETSNGNGNITNNKAYAVGQYWYTSTNESGEISYRMAQVDYVEIINPFTSRVRKEKVATNISTDYFQDNYYVAFKTDRNISRLLSATVSYRTRDYFYRDTRVLGFEETAFSQKATFSNEKQNLKEVNANEVINLKQEGFNLLFGLIDTNKQFTWQRIQSASNFVKYAGASDADKAVIAIQNLQWVLMFDETSVMRYESGGTILTTYEESGQIIDMVTVLRLEFVENGITYNLGTVSDTVSKIPDFFGGDNGGNGCTGCNGCGWFSSLPWWAWVLIIIFAPVVIFLLYKFIVWAVTASFKAIAKRGQERRAARQRKKQAKAKKPKTKNKSGG